MPYSSSWSFGTTICNFFLHHLCFTRTSWTAANSRRRFYSCQKYKAYMNFDFNFIDVVFLLKSPFFFFFGEMVVGLFETIIPSLLRKATDLGDDNEKLKRWNSNSK
ncbi:hypothetical protein CDL12_08343 [Handroanthus impetiginosus]|uniref:Uncharacterized protein n=1 Tax=Handroanthus impetiginosus TaxID=429701 RepID=A0A2G9HN91_9LAMI|nr:hypothetical protein CDL12_08343 [Handroanthus impetiginosus]